MRQFRNEIEKIAYELYEKSGKIDGHDFDHWLEAERIITVWQEQQKAAEEGKWRADDKPASPARVKKQKTRNSGTRH